MARRIERLWFEGSAGDRLDARLDLPAGDVRAYALFAHCFTCSKETAAATQITRGLVDQGIGVLRFDFTGLGSSEGDFANTNFSSNIEDLVRAADMLRHRHAAPKVLVGHSLGGTAVLAAAPQIPEAVAVVTIGAPFDPAQVTHLLSVDAVSELEHSGEVTVHVGGRPFPVRRQLLEDVNAQNLTQAIRDLHGALLVFHAPHDELVGIENARRIFDVAKHPKSFVSLDDADHLLSRRIDAAYVAQVLAAWVSRYLRAHAPPDRPVAREGTLVTDSPKRTSLVRDAPRLRRSRKG
ncbi:MAG: alpha/beta hydrolase family protein [Actinomycetota bacterium]